MKPTSYAVMAVLTGTTLFSGAALAQSTMHSPLNVPTPYADTLQNAPHAAAMQVLPTQVEANAAQKAQQAYSQAQTVGQNTQAQVTQHTQQALQPLQPLSAQAFEAAETVVPSIPAAPVASAPLTSATAATAQQLPLQQQQWQAAQPVQQVIQPYATATQQQATNQQQPLINTPSQMQTQNTPAQQATAPTSHSMNGISPAAGRTTTTTTPRTSSVPHYSTRSSSDLGAELDAIQSRNPSNPYVNPYTKNAN